MRAGSRHLFECFGVELEYMIVDAASLDVCPIADRMVHSAGKTRRNEVRRGDLRWSNELALHVIELKTAGPRRSLDGLDRVFQDEIRFLDAALGAYGCRLLPTAMHPWMDPRRDARLWPHGDRVVYEAFDRIFDCRGHGWTNLQSAHLNLPFDGDGEFRRLHTAVRLLLPLLPALAAASPFLEGRRAPLLDMRMEVYRHNCARVPSVTGRVIPEWISTPEQYQRRVLERIYRDMRPFDPDGILRHEWVNARGAIPRFDRRSIEIRVLDVQECPRADLAIMQFAAAILKSLTGENLSSFRQQKNQRVENLRAIFLRCLEHGPEARVGDRRYAEALGCGDAASSRRAGHILWNLLEKVGETQNGWRPVIEFILRRGNLARRIRAAAGGAFPGRRRLRETYGRLADCLREGAMFER